MRVSAELENLGDARLSKDIAASIEHALRDQRGDWRVTIAASWASENWEMRVEGPNRFERTYTLVGAAAEPEPEAIRRLIVRLVPKSSS